MTDPISLTAATVIAKIVLDKFYEGAGKKLEELATDLGGAAVDKAKQLIQKLGKVVWQKCFKGKPGVDKRLEAAAEGSTVDVEVLQDYVTDALEQDEQFAKEAKALAQEIHQVMINVNEVNARNFQQVTGGQGLQVNDAQAPVIQAENSPITINYNTAKD